MEFQEGMKFGKLTVIRPLVHHCECRCECGRIIDPTKRQLERGYITACKHCNPAEYGKKHGETHTRLYNIWVTMRQRCNNKNDKHYHRYGGRGIKVCDEWQHDYPAFRDWARSHGYDDTLSIDRIDNDGNYCPENCQWITISENSMKVAFDRRKKAYLLDKTK